MANNETAPSAEAWQRHVERWREGGLSVPDYCREHGLDIGAMRYQIRRATRRALALFQEEAGVPISEFPDEATRAELGRRTIW